MRKTQNAATLIINIVVALVLGAVVGAILTIGHRQVWWLNLKTPLYWGIFVALLGVAVFLLTCRLRVGWGFSVTAAIGMIILVFLFSQTSPGGSILVLNDWRGNLWSYGSTGIAALFIIWPRFKPRAKMSSPNSASENNASYKETPQSEALKSRGPGLKPPGTQAPDHERKCK